MDTMVKKIIYTKITPLPNNVPRELAVELLHAHEEVAKLNPLVTGVKTIDAPRDCPNEEYFSQWYEISVRLFSVPASLVIAVVVVPPRLTGD
jgi:hypothetical protein